MWWRTVLAAHGQDVDARLAAHVAFGHALVRQPRTLPHHNFFNAQLQLAALHDDFQELGDGGRAQLRGHAAPGD